MKTRARNPEAMTFMHKRQDTHRIVREVGVTVVTAAGREGRERQGELTPLFV